MRSTLVSRRKRFAPMGANSFLHEITPTCMGGNKNDRVASPESVPIHFKVHEYTYTDSAMYYEGKQLL